MILSVDETVRNPKSEQPDATGGAGAIAIDFSAAMTITPATPLPSLSRTNVSIDASTVTGASCGTLVSGSQHTLQVVLGRWSIRDSPETQLVHVAQVRPAELEGEAQSAFLKLTVLVIEGRLSNVVNVGERGLHVLLRRPQVRKLVHFLIILI